MAESSRKRQSVDECCGWGNEVLAGSGDSARDIDVDVGYYLDDGIGVQSSVALLEELADGLGVDAEDAHGPQERQEYLTIVVDGSFSRDLLELGPGRRVESDDELVTRLNTRLWLPREAQSLGGWTGWSRMRRERGRKQGRSQQCRGVSPWSLGPFGEVESSLWCEASLV